MKIYLVGGAVRDHLLGLPAHERDWVVVGSSAKEMEAQGFIPVGKQFPVFLHPTTHEEYALARMERKTGPGHKGFEITAEPEVSLETDLQRRDLTINAIAQDQNGLLIDPYGGQADLQARVLRHVSAAFSEDPLRVLRVARFKATLKRFQFEVANETLALMREISKSGELSTLPTERIWAELRKAFDSNHIDEFFLVLLESDALPAIADAFSGLSKSRLNQLLKRLANSNDLSSNTEVKSAIYFNAFAIEGAFSKEIFVQLLNSFGLPNTYQKLATSVYNHQQFLTTAVAKEPKQLLTFILNLDALRNPERFQNIIRAIFWLIENIQNTKPAISQEKIERISSSLQNIDHQALLRDHPKKADFLPALEKQRMTIVEKLLTENNQH